MLKISITESHSYAKGAVCYSVQIVVFWNHRVILARDKYCLKGTFFLETGGLFGLAVRMMQLFSDNKWFVEFLFTFSSAG